MGGPVPCGRYPLFPGPHFCRSGGASADRRARYVSHHRMSGGRIASRYGNACQDVRNAGPGRGARAGIGPTYGAGAVRITRSGGAPSGQPGGSRHHHPCGRSSLMLALLGFLTITVLLALVISKRASPLVALIAVPAIASLAAGYGLKTGA